MKNIFTNLIVFVALSVAFSNLTACTKTVNTQKTSGNESVSNDSANTNSGEVKNADYPPAPSGILQTEIKDLDGNAFKLEDKKGKVLLVNLWATWCGPCLNEMPEIAGMSQKYKDKGLEVIGVDVDDESPDAIRKTAERLNVNYQLALDNGKLLNEFIKLTKMQGIPQTIIINRDGKMVFIVGGGGPLIVGKMKEAVDKAMNE